MKPKTHASEEFIKLFEKMLSYIEHPQYGGSLIELGYFDSLEQVDSEQLTLFLKSSKESDDRKSQIEIEARTRKAYTQLKLPQKLKVKFKNYEDFLPQKKSIAEHIVAIASGKGGVGKSTVTANLAVVLQEQGLRVGVIDADIYGPSLGKMFGMPNRVQLKGEANKIYPYEVHGIKLVSFAFLLDPDQAVVWRGPMLGKAVEQFLFQVIWGDLDYLLIDLPPGTGDVQLSLAQFVELDGGIIVSTPQSMAVQDANRAARMFLQLKVPLLGIVENMAQFICPHCNKTTDIFDSGGGKHLAKQLSVPIFGSLPIQSNIMQAGETGRPISLDDHEIRGVYEDIARKIMREIQESE